jgi:hypothetical protein
MEIQIVIRNLKRQLDQEDQQFVTPKKKSI